MQMIGSFLMGLDGHRPVSFSLLIRKVSAILVRPQILYIVWIAPQPPCNSESARSGILPPNKDIAICQDIALFAERNFQHSPVDMLLLYRCTPLLDYKARICRCTSWCIQIHASMSAYNNFVVMTICQVWHVKPMIRWCHLWVFAEQLLGRDPEGYQYN